MSDPFEDACNRALAALEGLDDDERWQGAVVVAVAIADRCGLTLDDLLVRIIATRWTGERNVRSPLGLPVPRGQA